MECLLLKAITPIYLGAEKSRAAPEADPRSLQPRQGGEMCVIMNPRRAGSLGIG